MQRPAGKGVGKGRNPQRQRRSASTRGSEEGRSNHQDTQQTGRVHDQDGPPKIRGQPVGSKIVTRGRGRFRYRLGDISHATIRPLDQMVASEEPEGMTRGPHLETEYLIRINGSLRGPDSKPRDFRTRAAEPISENDPGIAGAAGPRDDGRNDGGEVTTGGNEIGGRWRSRRGVRRRDRHSKWVAMNRGIGKVGRELPSGKDRWQVGETQM